MEILASCGGINWTQLAEISITNNIATIIGSYRVHNHSGNVPSTEYGYNIITAASDSWKDKENIKAGYDMLCLYHHPTETKTYLSVKRKS